MNLKTFLKEGLKERAGNILELDDFKVEFYRGADKKWICSILSKDPKVFKLDDLNMKNPLHKKIVEGLLKLEGTLPDDSLSDEEKLKKAKIIAKVSFIEKRPTPDISYKDKKYKFDYEERRDSISNSYDEVIKGK